MPDNHTFDTGRYPYLNPDEDLNYIIENRWEKRFEIYAEFYNEFCEIEKTYNPDNGYDVRLYRYYYQMCEKFKELFVNTSMIENGSFHNYYEGCFEKVVK